MAVTKAKTVKIKSVKASPAKKLSKVQKKPTQKAVEESSLQLSEIQTVAVEHGDFGTLAPVEADTQKDQFQQSVTVQEEPVAISGDENMASQPVASVEIEAVSKVAPPLFNGSADQSSSKASALVLNLSESLVQRLRQKASSEGVGIDEFAAELLAEGLVLRAWEIMERKVALKQPSQSNTGRPGGAPQRFNNSFRGNQGGGNFNGNRPRQQGGGQQQGGQQQGNRRNNYKNVMEDQGSFMEYVRNQEKRKGP